MHPPPEYKDPPAYDSMYPGKAQEESSQELTCSSTVEGGQAIFRKPHRNPPEPEMTQGDTTKVQRKKGMCEGKEATDRIQQKPEEKRNREKEEEKVQNRGCVSSPGTVEVLQ